MNIIAVLITTTSLLLALSGPILAQNSYNNDKALKGVNKSEIYFDVNLNDAQKLELRMDLLQRTVQEIEESGANLSVVIGFRGGASRFITRDDHYVLEEEIASKVKIQDWIRKFAQRGITIEQCSIAAELYDIQTDDFLPEITIVKNGYVSLIGYQLQGYAVVSMD